MQEDIKTYVFEILPTGLDKWIVVAWGKIVNDRTGAYEQEIILKRYSENETSKIWDMKDSSKLIYCKVNLGSLRVLSPGTIIQNQRIVQFVHEYLVKTEIRIEDPKAMLKKPFQVLYDPIFPEWERSHLLNSIDKVETRFYRGKNLQIFIPCNVIADYYYYGETYLIKAIMEGKLDNRFKDGNDVYHPKNLSRHRSPTGKVIVRVELQRRMSFKDNFKIARLAHDYYFHSKSLDIRTGILRGSTDESYIDTDLPVEGPITLSVYGVEISSKGGNFFLVHSISKCSAKPPFDLILAGKPFKNESLLEDAENGSGIPDDSTKDLLGISPKARKSFRVELSKNGKKNIGGQKPLWNSVPKALPYNRNQENNFPKDAEINERDFTDPKKRDKLTEIIRKFGIAAGLSTNPNNAGSSNILQLGLFAKGPARSRPEPPTEAFQAIEELTLFIEEMLKGKNYQMNSNLLCPFPEGLDRYSAFPVNDLLNEPGIDRKKILNFCYLNIREKGHTHYRRIYIKELVVGDHFFYIMDVEPKYKGMRQNELIERFISLFGVIFYAHRSALDENNLRRILFLIVTTYKSPSGGWKFLNELGYRFRLIEHRVGQRSFDRFSQFIFQRL